MAKSSDPALAIDAIDCGLLNILQRDADRTIQQLAEEVGASPSSVQRRIKRLTDARIISRRLVHVDPRRVGYPLRFVVSVMIERKSEALYAALRRWVLACDAIQQCYNVTGAADFVMLINARSLEDYDQLMERMLADNPNVVRFETSAVLQTFKDGRLAPIA